MVTLKKRGFTLVELLTVVAIIALLIGILVPAVNQARKSAVKVAVRAQLSGISQGIEMFRNDFGYYPSSVPQSTIGVDANATRSDAGTGNSEEPINGAHRLAFALLGRDKLGCPAKKVGIYGPDNILGYYYTSGTGVAGSFTGTRVDTLANWGDSAQKTTRKGPYIDPKGFGLVSDTSSGASQYLFLLADKYDKRTEDNIALQTDYVNHSPILYYAANERGQHLYTTSVGFNTNANSIYYPQDNERIVLSGATASATTNFQNGYTTQNFFTYINDEKAQVGNTYRPVNPESFLLISKGYDGIYGTADDVTNWGD